MQYELAKTLQFPDWAPPDSRFWNLLFNEHWLNGTQYSMIGPSYKEESLKGKPLKMFDKRPSVRLQLPAIGAGIMKNKLFSPGRFPQIVHDKPAVVEAITWLIKAAQIDRKMLDAAYWGQAGSVGVSLRVIDQMPVMKLWKAHQCTPRYDDADKLVRLDVHYPVYGSYLISELELENDKDGNEIDAGAIYWYTRMVDQDAIWTVQPMLFDSWNPVDFNPEEEPTIKALTKTHDVKVDFPMAEWIRNGAVQIGCDGQSTFGLALPNCIALDYTLSQLQRGINAAAVPTLTVKGRILNYDQGGAVQVGPNSMIQLEADRAEGQGVGMSGADAKYLEMTGAGIQVGMEHLVKQLQHWTKDIMSMSIKDPDTIQGAISGKALEIINELPLDAVRVEQLAYGDYGLIPVLQKLGKMMILIKHEKFKNVTAEDLDELELKQQAFYQANAAEAAPLVTAMMTAVGGGMMHPEIGKNYLHSQLGVDPDSIEDKDKDTEKGRQQALEAIGKAPKPEADSKPPTKAKGKSDK